MKKVMKRILFTLALVMISLSAFSLSRSKIRNHARFITDRMAYELDLSPRQYEDCYEINYDFLYAANRIMDDVVYGYRDAVQHYYRLLDMRNEDVSYVLSYYQYSRYMRSDYFYRPIYSTNSRWYLRIYTTYNNRNFFYYDAPSIYKSYRGGHGRDYYSKGYYSNRYKTNDRYTARNRIWGSDQFSNSLRNDFGVNLRDRNETARYNNYNNAFQHNRTEDSRYRDVSGNRHSPSINTQSRGSSRSTTAQSTTSSRGNRTQPATEQPSTNGSRRGSTRTESTGNNTSRSTRNQPATTSSQQSQTTRAGRR